MKLHEKLDKTLSDQKSMQSKIDELEKQVNDIHAAQAGDTVVKSELDAAYREGVNSYE